MISRGFSNARGEVALSAWLGLAGWCCLRGSVWLGDRAARGRLAAHDAPVVRVMPFARGVRCVISGGGNLRISLHRLRG